MPVVSSHQERHRHRSRASENIQLSFHRITLPFTVLSPHWRGGSSGGAGRRRSRRLQCSWRQTGGATKRLFGVHVRTGVCGCMCVCVCCAWVMPRMIMLTVLGTQPCWSLWFHRLFAAFPCGFTAFPCGFAAFSMQGELHDRKAWPERPYSF